MSLMRSTGKVFNDHAFFNDSRPEVYSAEHSLEAWDRTLELFRETLR